jgi:peptidyl-prolyl cis-trans isomerase SurA
MDIHHIMLTAKKPSRHTMIAMTMLCIAFAAMPTAWGQASPSDNVTASDTSAAGANRSIRTLDSIVAVVNKDVITRRELEERIGAVEARIKARGDMSLPPRAELEKQVLEMMITETAQMQLAKEMGIQVDDIILDRAVARIAEQNKLTIQELRNQLEREGVAYAAFRENIRGEIVRQRLREREVDNKIQIPESEVENYLAAQSGATQPPELDIAQILVRIPENASAEQIAERQKRAEDLYQKLKTGADFTTLATTYSDADDALKGGDLGWRTADRLPELFLNAIAKLKPGEVSEIVKSANGFHILKFVGKRNPSVMHGSAEATTSIQQTHARHILIKVNEVVSAADAQRKLIDLKQRLDHNAAKFEDLAKSYSNDLSATNGGDLGWIYPGDTVPEFERAMDALKVGEVSEPIQSPFGYHLIQVLERKTADASAERQRLLARQAIRERKLEEATQDWLRQVRDRAYVEYHLDEK